MVAIRRDPGFGLRNLHQDRLRHLSLFFLVPLALVAMPALRLPRMALFNITVIWLVATLAMALAASPWIAEREMAGNPGNVGIYGARSELARELTEAWHALQFALARGHGDHGNDRAAGVLRSDHPAPFTRASGPPA